MLKLSGTPHSLVEERIDLGELGSCVVLLTRPTFADLVSDLSSKHYLEDRLRSVVGWREVADENGQLIEYSEERLRRACESCPLLFVQIVAAVNRLYSQGAKPKNSPTVSVGFSADTVLGSLKSLPISSSGELAPSPVPSELLSQT